MGAGVGQLTEALLGLSAIDKLISIELNPVFCERLGISSLAFQLFAEQPLISFTNPNGMLF